MLGQLITWLKADKKWIFFVVASLTAFLIFIFIWLLDQYRTPPSAVPPSYKERVEPLAKELGVTEKALRNFFNITNKKEVPLSDLDNTLREIATHHNALMEKLDSLSPSPTDPVVFALIVQAKQALEKGDFDQAERRDLKAATDAQETANQQLVLAAESLAVNGDSKMTQLAYQQAGEYFEHAAELLPAGHDGTLADYLHHKVIGLFMKGF
ncbi:MAG: hypothetical protein DRR19_22940 [Candidatus Parabeggiatoa sp. nov. 1]|nr:MAG: hypothetical protein DRR19_22940 [Gammaproteobacteria bacterium]